MSARPVVAAVALVVLVATPGCRRPPAAAPSPDTATTQPQPPLPGEVFTPSPLTPGERRPVVIFLHGLGGSGSHLYQAAELADFGRAHRVFVAAPDGEPDRAGRRFWNAGAACCDFDRTGIDDVGRLTAFVDWWRARSDVDPRRIYVVGFSNGGFMAHRLACAINDRLAAVVSVSGAAPDPALPCAVTSPIGVLEIHGDADDIVRYEGGRVFDSPAAGSFPSSAGGMRAWAARLGCRGPNVEETAVSHRTLRASGCTAGGAELWTIPGGGHRTPWPALVDEAWGFLDRWSKPSK